MGLNIKYIQIPVSQEEFDEIEALKGKQSWREFALTRLKKADLKKKK